MKIAKTFAENKAQTKISSPRFLAPAPRFPPPNFIKNSNRMPPPNMFKSVSSVDDEYGFGTTFEKETKDVVKIDAQGSNNKLLTEFQNMVNSEKESQPDAIKTNQKPSDVRTETEVIASKNKQAITTE